MPAAWHTLALELRGAEQKSTAGELFDVSACVSLMHHVETNQQNLGTRTCCWVLSGCVCMCDLCEESGINHCDDCANLSRTWLQSKMCACQRIGWPILFKSSAFKREHKSPPTRQDYQISQQLWQARPSSNRFTSRPARPALFSENVISYSHICGNLGQRTEIIYGLRLSARANNTLCPPLLIPSLLLALVLSPVLFSSPHLSSSSLLSPPSHIPLSPSLSWWFQACCIWPVLVSCDWNSNYDSLPTAFSSHGKFRYLSSAGLTLLSMLTL